MPFFVEYPICIACVGYYLKMNDIYKLNVLFFDEITVSHNVAVTGQPL